MKSTRSYRGMGLLILSLATGWQASWNTLGQTTPDGNQNPQPVPVRPRLVQPLPAVPVQLIPQPKPAVTPYGSVFTNQPVPSGQVLPNQSPNLSSREVLPLNRPSLEKIPGLIFTNHLPAVTNQSPTLTNSMPRVTNLPPVLTNFPPASTNGAK